LSPMMPDFPETVVTNERIGNSAPCQVQSGRRAPADCSIPGAVRVDESRTTRLRGADRKCLSQVTRSKRQTKKCRRSASAGAVQAAGSAVAYQ
jgi:hypothetical protein